MYHARTYIIHYNGQRTILRGMTIAPKLDTKNRDKDVCIRIMGEPNP